jgi:2-keto-4-pentenoate hydratase
MALVTPADTWADRLYRARLDRAAIEPISQVEPDLGPADAYQIQGHLVERLLADGGHVVGYKLGLTSKPMQELLGVDQPDYGPVLSTMVHPDGVELALSDYLQPKIEAEIALVLAAPLAGPGVTTVQAASAIGGAVAALELVDSRIADWRITLGDTIADLASSAAIVLGGRPVPLDGWDPRLVGMVVRRNGVVEATGAGAAALGDPVAAVAWLANTLAPFGVTLEPGHVIMTGALHAAFPVAGGDRIRAEFDRLGAVRCRFTEERG